MRLVTILTSIGFLLVIGLQLTGIVLRLREPVLVPVLARGAPVWLPLAVLCGVIVVAGMATEILRPRHGPFPPRTIAGRIVERVLDGLTGQARRGSRTRRIDAEMLATLLRKRLIGQDGACEEIAAQLGVRAGMTRRRSLGVFLLAGPPGSGKTLLGQALAEVTGRNLLHFDMAQFAELHSASQMFGVPPGYVGADRPGRLVAGLAERPDSVVLLDEIEKAHPEMLRKFLVAWNDGVVTDSGSGRQVSCTEAIFVLTSNAASDALVALARQAGDGRQMRIEATAALRRAGFAPEVLDRLDRILVFEPLDRTAILRIAVTEAATLVRACELQLGAEIDAQIFAPLLGRQTHAPASARDVARLLEEVIGGQLVAARAARMRRVRLIGQPDGIAVVAA